MNNIAKAHEKADTDLDNTYYVYVYIDPRNFQEFYYGKGKGSRKYAHLSDSTDSQKAKLIREIQEENLAPIIKVIAKGLTESEALLVEKTLIWKLGKTLTNISGGHFSNNFRPHNTIHKDLPGFDFHNDIFYVNIGEGEHRNWEDCRKMGFLSAGQGFQWRDQLKRLKHGDLVVAYLKNHGYVGVGRVTHEASRIIDFRNHDGLPISKEEVTAPRMFDNLDSEEMSEYLVGIKWIATCDRSQAKWKAKAGLFATPLVTASLVAQQITLSFIQEQFEINFESLHE